MFLGLRQVEEGDEGQVTQHGPAFAHCKEFMIQDTSCTVFIAASIQRLLALSLMSSNPSVSLNMILCSPVRLRYAVVE